MKKSLMGLFVLLALLSTANAETNVMPEVFCENPAAVVCGNVHQLEQNYDQLREYFLKIAFSKTQKTYPTIIMDEQGLDLSSLPESTQELAARKFTDSVDEAYSNLLAQKKISLEGKDFTESLVPIVEAASKYYEDAAIKNNLKNLHIVFTAKQFKAVSNQYVNSKNTFLESKNAYRKTCGSLTPNAVFDPYENTLIICPGLVLRTLSESGSVDVFSKQILLKYLTFIVGHEFSHSLDQYMHLGNFYQCLKTDTSFSAVEFNMIQKKRETYADFWAYKALSKSLEKQKTFIEKLSVLKNSMHALCLYETEGSHPTSKFRINTLLNYSDISNQFGCNSKLRPQCI